MSQPLVERLRGIAAELMKFAIVGGFCFVLDLALAYVFRFTIGLGPTTSKGLATIIATLVSYAGNRLWSFAHRVDADNGHGQDLSRYLGINAVGLVITLIPVVIGHYAFGLDSKIAFLVIGTVGTAFATVFRFWAYRKYVFAGKSEPAELAALV